MYGWRFQDSAKVLTYFVIFAKSDESEANREHSRMDDQRDGFIRILDLWCLVPRKADGHK